MVTTKVRAYLDFKKIKYMTVEVNPMSKDELDFTDYKKVPVATIDGKEVCLACHRCCCCVPLLCLLFSAAAVCCCVVVC
jgi:hypothetical protein